MIAFIISLLNLLLGLEAREPAAAAPPPVDTSSAETRGATDTAFLPLIARPAISNGI